MPKTCPDWVPEPLRICPYFDPDPPARRPEDTDEGYASTVEGHRGFALTLMMMLCLFQALCTLRGHPPECPRGQCRRTGLCSGRRNPRDWTSAFIGPVVPPCVPADTDIIIALRHAVRKKMNRILRSDEGEPVFHFTEDDVAEMLAFVTPEGLPERLDPDSPVSTGYIDRRTGKGMTFDEMVADHWERDPEGMARATGRSGPPRALLARLAAAARSLPLARGEEGFAQRTKSPRMGFSTDERPEPKRRPLTGAKRAGRGSL